MTPVTSDTPSVRQHLLRTLQADLVGPFSPDPAAEEVLPFSPLRWYLTGFLAPEDADQDADPQDDDFAAGDDEDEPDGGAAETQPRAPKRLPASLGISVLVPAVGDHLQIRLSYAEYAAVPAAPGGDAAGKISARTAHYRRVPVPPIVRDLPLHPIALRDGLEVAPGVWVEGLVTPTHAPGLDPGTRAVSVFVVNRRQPGARIEEQCLFQVALEVRHPHGLIARPNLRDEGSDEEDEQVADLQFRRCLEWAVGHGVSAVPVRDCDSGPVVGAATAWIPSAEVPRVETRESPSVTTDMATLGALADGAAARKALDAIAAEYGAWIAEQQKVPLQPAGRSDTRDMLLLRAGQAQARIARGVDLLAGDPQALQAFRLANQAMAQAALQRSPERYTKGKRPAWRMFQLAFLLLTLPGLADDADDDRDIVDLIFFPTGGGKTEAYLGAIAFTLVLRRLRGTVRPDGGLGVAVLLRYTLRLLTLDQLGRAATLICALELLRQADPAHLGAERFAIGLWVGRSATANTLDQAVEQVRDYKNARGPSPFPLPACPWCGAAMDAGSIEVQPNMTSPERVRVGCTRFECPFAFARTRDGIPVLFVDEQIYRELPCFLIATVDKFAMLPWRGHTGLLFGKATARVGGAFYGPMDSSAPKGATPLLQGLHPPELIVQDELHLISGPLGTMVGLYETGLAELCTRSEGGTRRVPKIIASTATVRRAQQQVRSLFGRERLSMFPPQGIDDSETFFAQVDRSTPGRLYVGVAAPGRAMKATLIRTYVTLLGGAQHEYNPGPAPPAGVDEQTADAYMTLVGYFNSLRELGGMRRLLEDEIRGRCDKDERARMPAGRTGDHSYIRRRGIKYEPAELTSRETTAAIARTKDLLLLPHRRDEHIDVVLASNMISVGLDIDRLGLMVIAGQPKTTSEYIQASSRVGRSVKRPGLVVTVFNLFRPRDRSHYERFRSYHECFYRHVEASSVTPFSAPALDRGLAGLLVAMARLLAPGLTMPTAVRGILLPANRLVAQEAVRLVAQKAAAERDRTQEESLLVKEEVTRQGTYLLDAWAQIFQTDRDGVVRYSKMEPGKGTPLLFTVLDTDRPDPTTDWGKFKAPTSMRDVEASVHLWKNRQKLTPMEGDDG